MISRAGCVILVAALLAGCAGSRHTATGTGLYLYPSAGQTTLVPAPSRSTALLSSSHGPTSCTVYGPGTASQIVFESSRLDVRVECQVWSANRPGAGYLWGYETAAVPDATRLCRLTDPAGNLTATVIEDTAYLPVSPAALARGRAACRSIRSSGWVALGGAGRP